MVRALSVKDGCQRGRCGHPAPRDQRNQEQYDSGGRRLEGPARTNHLHPETHSERDGNGAEQGEHAPRRFGQRLHDHQCQYREQNDHDHQDRDHRQHAGERPDLLLRHLTQRLAIATDRSSKDDEVLDGPAEDYADHDPDGAGEVAELGREYRPYQRSGAGDGGEVMSEEHPARRGHEVAAVGESMRRRGARVVELHDLVREEAAVKAVGNDVGADGRDDHPRGVDALAAVQREHRPARAAEGGDEEPGEGGHAAKLRGGLGPVPDSARRQGRVGGEFGCAHPNPAQPEVRIRPSAAS